MKKIIFWSNKLIIKKADSAGFCFGVKRAVDAVEENIDKYSSLSTYGPIIHNPQVVESLEKRGVYACDNIAEINTEAVVIRSHGAPPTVFKELEQKGIKIIDATCPYVKKIQQIVADSYKDGDQIIIVGERNHPEVEGINGYCNGEAIIIQDENDTKNLSFNGKKLCIVAQTTLNKEKWQKILAELHTFGYNIKVHNTICHATTIRQNEAREISAWADACIVIGGKNSSNTKKLADICRQNCSKTYEVECLKDIPTNIIYENANIGVTAGASTPDWLIEEVITKMNELDIHDGQDSDFLLEMDKTLVRIRQGQQIKGTVVYVNDTEAGVNIGYKSDGFIAKDELTVTGDVNPRDILKEGDEIDVEVLKVNDGNGNVILSRKAIIQRLANDKVLSEIDGGNIFEVEIKEAVKGGLMGEIDGVRIFIPASQIRRNGFVRDLNTFIGQKLRVKALDVDTKKRRVVASAKLVAEEEHSAVSDQFWSNISEGKIVKGVIRRMTDFGAFVDLGGFDGLLHIGDMTWFRTNKPNDLFQVNDEIEVVVLAIDKEKERISLGYKQLHPKPWDNILEKYPMGAIVVGKVARITAFGAFIALEAGVDGLVHISEVSNTFLKHVEDALKIGQEIEAQVLNVDPDKKRISLSIKALMTDAFDEPIDGEDTSLINPEDTAEGAGYAAQNSELFD